MIKLVKILKNTKGIEKQKSLYTVGLLYATILQYTGSSVKSPQMGDKFRDYIVRENLLNSVTVISLPASLSTSRMVFLLSLINSWLSKVLSL